MPSAKLSTKGTEDMQKTKESSLGLVLLYREKAEVRDRRSQRAKSMSSGAAGPSSRRASRLCASGIIKTSLFCKQYKNITIINTVGQG